MRLGPILRDLAITLAVLLLEGTVGSRIAWRGVRPDFALAWVVYAGLFGGPRRGTLIGLLVGLLHGCTDPEWLGLESLLLSLVGFAAGCTSPVANRSHPIVQGTMIVMLLLMHDLVRAFVITSASVGDALLLWVQRSPATALYTVLVVPAAVAMLPRLFQRRRTRGLS